MNFMGSTKKHECNHVLILTLVNTKKSTFFICFIPLFSVQIVHKHILWIRHLIMSALAIVGKGLDGSVCNLGPELILLHKVPNRVIVFRPCSGGIATKYKANSAHKFRQ